jgi:hypothetical protein
MPQRGLRHSTVARASSPASSGGVSPPVPVLSACSDGGELVRSTDGVGHTPTYTNYFDGAGQNIKLTTTQYGRQVSVVRYDANGGQLGQTTYGYDAQGRQNTSTADRILHRRAVERHHGHQHL